MTRITIAVLLMSQTGCSGDSLNQKSIQHLQSPDPPTSSRLELIETVRQITHSEPVTTMPSGDPADYDVFNISPQSETDLISDGLRYSATVDPKTDQFWLQVHGGINGNENWYGPFDLHESRFRRIKEIVENEQVELSDN